MRTDELIAALAADDHPAPRLAARLGAALAGGGAATLALWALGWGPRADLGAALGAGALAKTLVPAAFALLGAGAAWALIRPAAPLGSRLGLLGAAGLALLLWFAQALAQGGAPALAQALDKPDLWVCLWSVPLLALAPLAATLWAMRAGAPTRPALAGAAAGLAAGGLAAAVYSLFCTVDMALFVIPAYGAAVLGVVAAGAVAGARVLRW